MGKGCFFFFCSGTYHVFLFLSNDSLFYDYQPLDITVQSSCFLFTTTLLVLVGCNLKVKGLGKK